MTKNKDFYAQLQFFYNTRLAIKRFYEAVIDKVLKSAWKHPLFY